MKLKEIFAVLSRNCSAVQLKRFDQKEGGILEASFLVDFNSVHNLEKTKENLEALSKSINITYLDKQGLY